MWTSRAARVMKVRRPECDEQPCKPIVPIGVGKPIDDADRGHRPAALGTNDRTVGRELQARDDTADAHREGAAGAWRNAFIRMPYARERTIERGIINDTFETAITWDRFEFIHDKVKVATERAILEATGRTGRAMREIG